MTSDIRVHVTVANAGTVDQATGCLNLLNAGWSWTASDPSGGAAFVVAAIIEVPSHLCGSDLTFTLDLVSADEVIVRDDAGRPIVATQVVHIERHPETPRGALGVGTVLVEFPAKGLALTPGVNYAWRVSINGQHDPQWRTTFWVWSPR